MAVVELLAPELCQCLWKSLRVSATSHSTRRFDGSWRRQKPKSPTLIVRAAAGSSRVAEENESRPATWFDWSTEWYPVAIENELDKAVPHAFTIIGNDLVLWWDRTGTKWQAFVDKCPHRLAPLSEGRIAENGHLQCSYHGWMFSPQTGSCSRIPQAAPENSKLARSPKACATVYPVMEQQGILWVMPTTSADPTARPPPFFPVLEDSSFDHYWATSDLPYGYEALIENLVDPTHVPFAHHKLQGNRNMAVPVNYTVNKFDRWGFKGHTGRGEVVFQPPCSFVMEIKIPTKNKVAFPSCYSIAQANLFEQDDPEKLVYTVFMCVPVAPGRSKVFWSFPRNFDICSFSTRISIFSIGWFVRFLVSESLRTLVFQEQRQRRTKEAEHTPTSADAFVLGFRRWLNAYAGGAPDYAPHIDRKLPPSLPKKQLMDRYENHVKRCPTCMAALNFFKMAELGFQVAAVAILAAALTVTAMRRPSWGVLAVLLWIASRYTSHFITKNYHFHDYNHALVK